MRIIAGDARGRRLVAPEGLDTRPTADKTRESLFSILMRDLPGAKVLDLFGGTGALALEAMSRGAACAVICDKAPAAIRSIKINAAAVMKDRPGVRMLRADYKAALQSLAGEEFDLIFIDPPYHMTEAYTESAQLILRLKLLSMEGQLILERRRDTVLALPPGLKIRDTRLYRDTAIDFAVYDQATEENV